ncbi:hypothetical protein [Dactylosporangium sp. CA-092794]|uniref:hypothetical protein n=1 Tax=Dactylosporangium sp. CA-092794 TaxID=3239929 RepID=UPI003D8AE4CE
MTDQTTARRRRRVWSLAAATAVVLLAVGLRPAAAWPEPGASGPYQVSELDYNLGDTAFHVPGFHQSQDTSPLAGIELAADVHYPAGLRGGPYPLVVLLHGYWATCDDHAAADIAARGEAAAATTTDPAELDRLYQEITAAYTKLYQWPCPPGTPALPSFRGLDYVAHQLAAHGMVVISISANGINAGQIGDAADNARAALINKHLDMWRQLVRTGGGPLAGKLTDPGTHRPRAVDFTGRVDLHRVGTLGHSRGGRAVAYQAADVHRAGIPSGVHIAAVLALAPAGAGTATEPGSPDAPAYRVTSAPLAVWLGTCDGATGDQGQDYVDLAAGHTTDPVYRWRVSGANHNFLNTEWSPSSGRATAADDFAQTAAAHGLTRPGPGLCGEIQSSPAAAPSLSWTNVTRQLTEARERQVAAGYITAYFTRTLLGDTAQEAAISGAAHPYAAITAIDASRIG